MPTLTEGICRCRWVARAIARAPRTIDLQSRRGTPTPSARRTLGHLEGGRPAARSRCRATIAAPPSTPVPTPGIAVATGPLLAIAAARPVRASSHRARLDRLPWSANRLADADQDGFIDGFPGVTVLEPLSNTSERTLDYLVPVMGRVGWERGPHSFELTLIGHSNRDTAMLANATQQAAGIDRIGYVADGIATYRGTWKRTHVRAQAAWHRSVATSGATMRRRCRNSART